MIETHKTFEYKITKFDSVESDKRIIRPYYTDKNIQSFTPPTPPFLLAGNRRL